MMIQLTIAGKRLTLVVDVFCIIIIIMIICITFSYDRFKNSEKIDEEAVDENNDVKVDDGSNLDAINQNGVKPQLQ